MKQLLVCITVLFLCNGCFKKNKNLISFDSFNVMNMEEIPEDDFKKLTDSKNFHPSTDTILYSKDTIYISYLAYVNACSKYDSDIEIIDDTLFLRVYQTNYTQCASGRVDRFIYKILNPSLKKYSIAKY